MKFQFSWRYKVSQSDDQSRNEQPGKVGNVPLLREVQAECRHEFTGIQETKVPLLS